MIQPELLYPMVVALLCSKTGLGLFRQGTALLEFEEKQTLTPNYST